MPKISADDIILEMTCPACPEQYDAYYKVDEVEYPIPCGYLRLRHGYFSVEYPHCGGDLVFSTEECKGDGLFEEEERAGYLHIAKQALADAINQRIGL